MQVNPQEVSAEKATTAATELRLVSVEQLQKIHRELDACQKVIWLAGCGQRGYGFDPAYVTGAQEQLKGIETLIAAPCPAVNLPCRATVPARVEGPCCETANRAEIMAAEAYNRALDDVSNLNACSKESELERALKLAIQSLDQLLPYLAKVPADIGLLNQALMAGRQALRGGVL